jgi:hypothetical protein
LSIVFSYSGWKEMDDAREGYGDVDATVVEDEGEEADET